MRVLKSALLVSLALATSGAALASTAAAGLIGTRHDFATRAMFLDTQFDKNGVAIAAGTQNAVGLCSYCHTPHSALSTNLLWNHKPSTNASFGWNEAKTSGGTPYPTIEPTYKGPSVKCLSCHDGSVAIGDVNMYTEKAISRNSYKVGTAVGSDIHIVGAAGAMGGNHPVAMPYPFGQNVNKYNSKDTGAEVVRTEFVGNPVNQNGTFIKLYNDADGLGSIGSGAVADKSGMECSTCHDPHNKQTADDVFLRGKIKGSAVADGYICIQCHIK